MVQCLDPLQIEPPPSPTNPVPYGARVQFENRVVMFSGQMTFDVVANPSPLCKPNGTNNTKGFYVGTITCTCCGSDFLTDVNNCGTCGNACQSHEYCSAGICLGSGEIELSLTWQRSGDLNLYVIYGLFGLDTFLSTY